MGRPKESIKDGYGHLLLGRSTGFCCLSISASSLIVLMASWVGGGPQL